LRMRVKAALVAMQKMVAHASLARPWFTVQITPGTHAQ
jgi:hypothetical protein